MNEKRQNTKSTFIKLGIAALISFTLTLLCLKLFGYMDSQVYQPIGTIDREKAVRLKQIGMIIALPVFLLSLLAYLITPLCLVLSWVFRKRRKLQSLLLISAVIFGTIAITTKLTMSAHRGLRHQALERTMTRGQTVINALEAFKTRTGNYPQEITELAPDFIAEIPSTGMAGYPEFVYKKASPENPHFKDYELMVNTPLGILNWDVFIYWPEGNYPEHLYGGYSELIDDWGLCTRIGNKYRAPPCGKTFTVCVDSIKKPTDLLGQWAFILASPSKLDWNQVYKWLHDVESLREAVSNSP